MTGQPADSEHDGLPPQIGPYRVERVLGIGGTAVVYAATCDRHPGRRVALKVLTLAGADADLLLRFDLERRVVAQFEHPCIARLLDAGLDAHGRPFLAMELVEGLTLVDHCRRAGLATRERLQLFLQVCRGVQHAHQRGVLHRDLKPTNILVADADGVPVPKIIDFGLARLLGSSSNRGGSTAGIRLGTPEYMSPEQAGDLAAEVDVRSDVYSLGVVLYELLADGLPWPMDPAGRPIDRLAPLDLRRRYRGGEDLCWVVAKAMAFEPDRRYAGPGELADDVARSLAGAAVAARRPDLGYRLRRAIARHRPALASVAIGAGGLLATGLALHVATQRKAEETARTERLAVELAEQRDRTVDHLADLEGFAGLLGGVLMKVHPAQLGPQATFAEVLRAAAADLQLRPALEPAVLGRAAQALAEPLALLGEDAEARRLAEQAVPLLSADPGPDARALLAMALLRLGYLASRGADRRAAEEHFAAADQVAATVGSPRLRSQTRGAMAQTWAVSGHYARAAKALEELIGDEGVRADPRLLATAHANLGSVLGRMGDAEGSLRHSRLGFEMRLAHLHVELATFQTGWQLGRALLENGRADEAVAVLQRNQVAAVAAFGRTHREVADGEVLLHYARARHGEADAVEQLRAAIAEHESWSLPTSQLCFQRGYLVGALLSARQAELAMAEATAVVGLLAGKLSEEHLDVVQLRLQIGTMFSALGEPERSLPILEAALAAAERSPQAAGMAPRIALAIASSCHRLGRTADRDQWAARAATLGREAPR